ncbi:Dimeric alpha-beta barrel [Penicillium taxi]|uniref:Dimeric alpha-beta barrel n=1 Tax=Penicillium taxi TaxID=168475 RepID=UPI0025453706|nr:Dimeric alpha-beta barrel [Penicillium taxi]KAJ5893456.1 Dimeric alpha-beta barrel [Penicillium taxi]
MVFHAVVTYPNDEDIKFDEEYYLKTHMPLVESIWAPQLLSWSVIKYTNDMSGNRSQYLIAARLVFESQESMQTALKSPKSAEVFADISNFTNKTPITLAGADL